MIKTFESYIKESKGFSFEVNDIFLNNKKYGQMTAIELNEILQNKQIYVKRIRYGFPTTPKFLNPIFVDRIHYHGMRDSGEPILKINDEYYLYLSDTITYKEPKIIFSSEDPYGEENWESESISHIDVDPYGEEDWNDFQVFTDEDRDYLIKNRYNIYKEDSAEKGAIFVSTKISSTGGREYYAVLYNEFGQVIRSSRCSNLKVCLFELDRIS